MFTKHVWWVWLCLIKREIPFISMRRREYVGKLTERNVMWCIIDKVPGSDVVYNR
jgi:hypothetical protein